MRPTTFAIVAAGLIALAQPASAAIVDTTLDFDYLTAPGGGPYPTQVTQGYSVTPAIKDGLFLFSGRHPYNADQDGASALARSFGCLERLGIQWVWRGSMRSVDDFRPARSARWRGS